MDQGRDDALNYDFDRLPNRRGIESLKWKTYDKDVLPLWVADMDFMSPEPVIRALRERVEHGVFGYLSEDMSEIRQVFVDRLVELYNWEVQPDDLVFMPGVITGFNLACHTMVTPGRGVLVQTPSYPPILRAPENANRYRLDVELVRDLEGEYKVGWDAFQEAVSRQIDLFILCNPHNPVGRVFRQDKLERMAELCLRRDVVICSDEIHCDLVYKQYRHIPIASLDPEIADNTVTLMAPSKTYNLPGLKFSVAVVQNRTLRRKYRRMGGDLLGGVNLMGRVAALSAYRDGQEWLDQILLYLEVNRDYLYEYVEKELSGISMAVPEGTYLAWLDCREAGIEGNPQNFFLQKARVALNDGITFGKGGEGFVRLNFGCPRSILSEALDRMSRALQDGDR